MERRKNSLEITKQKMYILTYNECDSLTSRHRITQDRWTSNNQSNILHNVIF